MKKFAIALALGAGCMPAAAFAQDDYYDEEDEYVETVRDGLRIEARAVWESISDPEEELEIVYELGKAVGFGGEIGYDFAINPTTAIGPFVTLERSGVESCADGLCLTAKDFIAIGVHAGFATGENGQVFGKVAYTEQTFDLVGPIYIPEFDETFLLDERETGSGFQIAFGYEHGFGDTAYGRIEMGVGENYEIYDFDWQRVTLGAALGVRF